MNHRVRELLTGGDRRSIGDSNLVRAMVERDPALVRDLAELTGDDNPLVSQRALDLLEKLARAHVDWIQPHKRVFIGPAAEHPWWEVRLQVVRALSLFTWTPAQRKRVIAILRENVNFPQSFVRAWALDSLATLAERDAKLMPHVKRALRAFEASTSKALQARARQIRLRLATFKPWSRA